MRFLGRASELPAGVQQDMREAVEKTAKNTGMVLCLALNYGGRAEIVDALNEIVAQRRAEGRSTPVSEEEVSRHLYTAGLPDPDLLIRSSGEMRVSNFLLWQIAYAEILVTETLWPDFNRARLLEAFVEFSGANGDMGASAKVTRIPTCLRALLGSRLTSSKFQGSLLEFLSFSIGREAAAFRG